MLTSFKIGTYDDLRGFDGTIFKIVPNRFLGFNFIRGYGNYGTSDGKDGLLSEVPDFFLVPCSVLPSTPVVNQFYTVS